MSQFVATNACSKLCALSYRNTWRHLLENKRPTGRKKVEITGDTLQRREQMPIH